MKERLLFNRVALDAGDISPWDVQRAFVVEANLADTYGSWRNPAVVSARVALDPPPVEPIVDVTLTSASIQQLAEARHAFNCTFHALSVHLG